MKLKNTTFILISYFISLLNKKRHIGKCGGFSLNRTIWILVIIANIVLFFKQYTLKINLHNWQLEPSYLFHL